MVVLASFAVIVALYSFRHAHARPGSASVHQHREAPDFTLPLVDGGPLRLSSYRGKIVLLDFWATWCVPCREQTPRFVELQREYGDRGLQIIGVAMEDSPDPVRTFSRQFEINYPVVMGTADVGVAYGGVLGLPIAFLVDRQGRIRAKHMGATNVAVFENEIRRLLSPQH